MRVRTFFVCCISVMAALVAIAAALFVTQEWARYRSAGEAGHLTQAMGGLLQTAEKLALSRGPQNAVLTAEQPAGDPARQALAPARQAITAALKATEDAIALTAYPERGAALASLHGFAADLETLNRRVDQAILLPRAQRDPALVQDYVPRMFGFANMLNGLANTLERSAASADPTVGRLLGMARLSWDMRDAGSRRSSVFTGAVGSGRQLTMADMVTISGLSGEARHAWARLRDTASQVEDAPRIAVAMQETEAKFFGETDRFIAGLVTRGLAGTDYGGTFQEVWSRLVGGAQAALLVRDAAIEVAATRAGMIHREAGLRLSVAVGVLAGVVAAVIGIAILFDHRVVDPLVALTAAIRRLAAGDRETAVPTGARHDEIGEIAGALETLRQNAIEAARLEAESHAQAEARQARAAGIEALTRSFDAASASVIQAFEAASAAVREDAQASSALASDGSVRTATVAAGAEQASVSVGTIAAAAEEMSRATAEIAERVERCAAIAADAVREVGGANTRIGGLDQAVERIGTIIKLIQDIATQTNLLALNATIEAARAGDAGKGFAVVAGEVKALATQTARATEDITAQIAAIETETAAAVQAIRSVSQTIGRVDAVTADIAAAVTQQRETTGEIAANAQQAARGTKDVSANVGAVNAAMAQAETGAHRMIAAADDLAVRSRDLTDRIATFLGGVRAA